MRTFFFLFTILNLTLIQGAQSSEKRITDIIGRYVPSTIEGGIDTEISGGTTILVLNIKDLQTTGRAVCKYTPLNQVQNRIKINCHRIILEDGSSIKIKSTFYDPSGQIGIDASKKTGGALFTKSHSLRGILLIEDILYKN